MAFRCLLAWIASSVRVKLVSCKCRAAALEGEGTLVARMDRASETEVCGCERVSVSRLSPGPIKNEEELHFIVPHPDGLLNGKLNPTFLTQIDRNGLSILRGDAQDSEFEQTLNELKERWAPSARKFHGVATFSAANARYDKELRLCCVYDTGLPGKPHHGDIAGPALTAESNSAMERARRKRIKCIIDNAVTRFEAAATFRGGVFSRFSGD